jgi:hypothetical protein
MVKEIPLINGMLELILEKLKGKTLIGNEWVEFKICCQTVFSSTFPQCIPNTAKFREAGEAGKAL